MAHQGEIFSNRSVCHSMICPTPEVPECVPYNENARLMTTMFRQQLINCATFLHASPSEICLRPTAYDNVHMLQACSENERKGGYMQEKAVRKRRRQIEERGRERESRMHCCYCCCCCGTLFERASASSRDGKQKYTGPLCAQVECARVRGLHGGTSACFHIPAYFKSAKAPVETPRAFKLRALTSTPIRRR